ncbi:MAG: hypothetical protein ACI4PW_05205, partial [Alphaproteobacteria bacterium]
NLCEPVTRGFGRWCAQASATFLIGREVYPIWPAIHKGPGTLFQANNQALERQPLRQSATAGNHISPLRIRSRIALAEA